ncbi:hypothetical protein PDE_01470 [Penicillium oxalicum 114-2]|uniref:Uncharacterized protein n=1 Tax=Penicillium oxalicum (strain 114-2 / CGMCC 5302) TaxID=933388 RepID=S8AL06_PENO1|nr:hypothetical protein PDE_01470 [Penicillium oxalicum 114-2]
MIKAGDEGVFTSSVFNWISRRQAQVSWRPLYEAVFREIEFKREFNRIQQKEIWCCKMGPELERYASHAGVDNKAEDGDDPFLFDVHEVQRPEFDRQFMYLPSKVRTETLPPYRATYSLPNDEEINAPWGQPFIVLVSSVRPLKYLPRPSKKANGNRSKAVTCPDSPKDIQPLWIDCNIPCIEVSEEEIAALALILGISLTCPHFLVQGIGAFNVAMNSRLSGCLTKYRLVYSGGPDPRSNAKGSGYSTLFAKHLACGCLPFACDDSDVHTIAIDNVICQSIKKGKPILDKKSKWTTAMYYLDKLPASRGNNFYHQSQSGGDTGDIISWENKIVGKWWEAVAGIAFGGLVPFATKAMADAVSFSVGEFTGNRAREYLMRLLLEVDKQSHPAIQNMRLFGYTAKLSLWRKWADGKIGLTFQPDPTDYTTRITVERLASYCTLLERMMACTSQSGHDLASDVFRCCSAQIEQSYTCAVGLRKSQSSTTVPTKGSDDTSKVPTGFYQTQSSKGPQYQSTSIEDDLDHILQKIRVLEWANIVREVHWEDNFDAGSDPSERKNTVAYKPVLMSNLPDTSLWE